MINTLMILQAVVSVLLIIVVLLQFGKGAEAGLFSGGGSDAVFTGSQRGNIFSKITTILAIIFLGNSIFLAKLQSTKTSESLLDGETPVARPLNNDAATPAPTPAKKAEAPANTETNKKQ